jgi:ABC-type antimicrobial peptide transport system permease subunit
VSAGAAIGIPASALATRWVQSMLFGVDATDPLLMVAAVALLVAVALVASFLPARRASRVNPNIALRTE